MRNPAARLGVPCAFAFAVIGLSAPAVWPTTATAAQLSIAKPEQQLTKLESDWNEAEVKKDFGLLNRVLSDDYTDTQPEGTIVTKAQTIASLRSGEDVVASCTLSNMKVRVYGSAAVVLYLYRVQEKFRGKDVSGSYQITDVWVKRNSSWQLVASHASRISNP